MEDAFVIKQETSAQEDLSKEILARILSYNASRAGPLNDSKYVLTVRSGDGDLAGGLVAVQFWNGMFVDLLWVDEKLRHRGIGTQLMRRAEEDLVARGGEVIFLSTWSFQAPAFYEKLGYSAFGKLDGMPPGSTRTWFVKWLLPPPRRMDNLAARIRQCAKIEGRFVLRSGGISDTYFDKYQFEAQPDLLLAIAERMAKLLPRDVEVLAGLEMGGIPIVTMLSQVTRLPAAFVRKQPKEYGTCRYAEGASLDGRRFVLIEDVVSSGGAIIDALNALKADGLIPAGALCVIDRETGGAEALSRVGLPFKALFTLSEIQCG